MGMGLSRTWLTQAADSPLSRHPSAPPLHLEVPRHLPAEEVDINEDRSP